MKIAQYKNFKLNQDGIFSGSRQQKGVSADPDSVNALKSLRAAIPLQYLTVIENCMNKCDVWRSRVNYYNCMKSCKRENKIIKSLESREEQEQQREQPQEIQQFLPVLQKTGSGGKLYFSKCNHWLCALDRSMCGPGCEGNPMFVMEKRQAECLDGEDCNHGGVMGEQPRKRRWGDTLTTCIASYCNSLGGVKRVDCIINKCDKQRRRI